MKTHIPIKTILTIGAFASSFLAYDTAFAATLPAVNACSFDPTGQLQCYTTTTDAELYLASAHDDFLSFGARIIDEYRGMGYSELESITQVAGSGQILKLFTYNQSNNGIFPPANTGTGTQGQNDTFPEPPKKPGDPIEPDYWPITGTFSIANLESFLAGGTTPVFAFDFGEPQQDGQFLTVNGYFTVSSANGSVLKDTFSFDDIFNSAYDQASMVTAVADQPIYWKPAGGVTAANCALGGGTLLANFAGVIGNDVCTKEVTNVLGGGFPEFYAYAPGFSTKNYAADDIFKFVLRLDDVQGNTELFLTNAIVPPGYHVPEPGIISLLGLGLFGMSAVSRKFTA